MDNDLIKFSDVNSKYAMYENLFMNYTGNIERGLFSVQLVLLMVKDESVVGGIADGKSNVEKT